MATAAEPRKKKKPQQWEEKIEKAQGFSEKIMAIAAAIGFLACFLPAVSFEIEMFGKNYSDSVKVIGVWQGKFGLLGYIAIGVMAMQMMKHAQVPVKKNKLLACLIVSGVVVLLSFLLLMDASGMSKGIGLWINILASLAMLTGSALKAKQAKLF